MNFDVFDRISILFSTLVKLKNPGKTNFTINYLVAIHMKNPSIT